MGDWKIVKRQFDGDTNTGRPKRSGAGAEIQTPMTLLASSSLYYQNVNLIAQPTSLESRGDVPQEKWRIAVSPMQSIVGAIFAQKALQLGLTVCLHRFDTNIERRLDFLREVQNSLDEQVIADRLWISVEMKNPENAARMIKEGGYQKNVIIDVANGYMRGILDYSRRLFDETDGKISRLMLGNIHSSSILPEYLKLASELNIPIYYRCGIASGSACNTKGMTGYNRGQITEISECAGFSSAHPNLILVADGGIADPSCAAKAFGAGADMIMLGGYFSHAKESQHVIDEIFKFWGGASAFQQMITHGEVPRHSEGKELSVQRDRLLDLERLVNDLWGGVSSAVSYSGHSTLQQFIGHGVFEQIARDI